MDFFKTVEHGWFATLTPVMEPYLAFSPGIRKLSDCKSAAMEVCLTSTILGLYWGYIGIMEKKMGAAIT